MSDGFFTDHMPAPHQIIHIEPAAPRKPALGAACNGCGVCCLVAPCPLGVVLSGRRTGACVALLWEENSALAQVGGVYRCGAITQPTLVLSQALPESLLRATPALARVMGALAKRWVAAGKGCDSSVEVEIVESDSPSAVVTPSARMPYD